MTTAPGNDIRDIELPVFHGTRQSCAVAIFEQGFRPTPVREQIAAVAATFEVPIQHLFNHLEANDRFAHLDQRATGTISLTADPIQAGSWANRAPEASWEALWSVYRLRHPDLGDDWNQSDEGHFWVLAQQISDPPVFITASAPLGQLLAWPDEKTAADVLLNLARTGQTDFFPKLFTGRPEWRADPSHLKLAGFQEVPTRLDPSLARFISGEDAAMFAEQVDAGQWGEPGGHDRFGAPWFSFDEIWHRLTPARQTELEAVAGHPLA